jgi:cell wall-associated NlpC family hydrolase
VTRAVALRVAIVTALVASSLVGARAAFASRIDDLRARARQIAAQIDSNGERIAALGEQYDGAQLQLQQIRAQEHTTTQAIQRARAATTQLRGDVSAIAARLYVTNGSGAVSGDALSSVGSAGAAAVYAQSLSARDQGTIDRLHAAQADLADHQHALHLAEARATAQVAHLDATRRAIQAANTREQSLLAQVKGELGRLVREEQIRAQQAAAAAARARAAADAARLAAERDAARLALSTQSPSGDPGSTWRPPGPLPAPSSMVGQVIAYAEAQLGKPYVYDTAGPNTFDCSGLTMAAWAQVGVSMPHYSGAQYAMFPHVPLSDMQPGDLMFWGSGGSQHVALYIGGGMTIQATHTGSFVLELPADYSTSIGAARP